MRAALLQLNVTATAAVPTMLTDLVAELQRPSPLDAAVAQHQAGFTPLSTSPPQRHHFAIAPQERPAQCQLRGSPEFIRQREHCFSGMTASTANPHMQRHHHSPTSGAKLDDVAPRNAGAPVDPSEATADRAGRILPSMRVLLVGAGRLDAQLLAAVGRVMPHATILTAYGMTEAASSMTFRKVWPTHVTVTEPEELSKTNVGRPAPGVQLAICEGQAVRADRAPQAPCLVRAHG
jgi:acyl-CoA synthetase (AMP-forming)/AMP-acid ligase II